MEDNQINTNSSSSNNNNNKRSIRDDDELISELSEAKRIRDSLLDDESEFLLLLDNNNNNSENQDLISFMKSFEEEISLPLPLTNKEEEISSWKNNEEEISLPLNEVEIASSLCGGDQLTPSELLIGFLLEASDDELGLPPTSSSPTSSSNEELQEGEINSSDGDNEDMLRVSSEMTVGFDDHKIWGFEDEISRKSTNFEFDSAEIVNFEGLFDYCDHVNDHDDDVLFSLCGISDFSDFSCRSEWLPVL